MKPSGPVRRRRDARDAWSRIKAVAPQYADLAEYFGGLSVMRSRVEAGWSGRSTTRSVPASSGAPPSSLDAADVSLLAYEQGRLPGAAVVHRELGA